MMRATIGAIVSLWIMGWIDLIGAGADGTFCHDNGLAIHHSV